MVGKYCPDIKYFTFDDLWNEINVYPSFFGNNISRVIDDTVNMCMLEKLLYFG